MRKVYVYETDSGMDIFLSHRALTDEERYCPVCNEFSNLLLVSVDVQEMINLFSDYGYTPNTPRYKELIEEFNDILGGSHGRVDN